MIIIMFFEWHTLLFIFSLIRNILGFGRERNVRFGADDDDGGGYDDDDGGGGYDDDMVMTVNCRPR